MGLRSTPTTHLFPERRFGNRRRQWFYQEKEEENARGGQKACGWVESPAGGWGRSSERIPGAAGLGCAGCDPRPRKDLHREEGKQACRCFEHLHASSELPDPTYQPWRQTATPPLRRLSRGSSANKATCPRVTEHLPREPGTRPTKRGTGPDPGRQSRLPHLQPCDLKRVTPLWAAQWTYAQRTSLIGGQVESVSQHRVSLKSERCMCEVPLDCFHCRGAQSPPKHMTGPSNPSCYGM